jgi:S-adenosylmethionine:tRNA ribosyltransferase-isomerase
VHTATRIDDLRYELALENLEGTPREIRLGRRDLGRMLVVNRATGSLVHSHVKDLPQWFDEGDVLVLNNSKRIPGVLNGRTHRGGSVELRFVELEGDDAGVCRIFPLHDVTAGDTLTIGDGPSVLVQELGLTRYELARVRVERGSLAEVLRSHGRPISGFFYENHWSCDHLNPYYATVEGTVESPLAGLHFTPGLVATLEAGGVSVCFVTLHSVGSWLPFLEDSVEEHEMWPEYFSVPEPTAALVNEARDRGRRVFACGSTSLRALEAAASPHGAVVAQDGRTTLYITPGYRFCAVDAFFTNFHQSQTSMIVLDAAFAGAEFVMEAYREARAAGYAFFEFGDAVLFR